MEVFFYTNKIELPRYYYIKYQNDMIIDHFTISKTNKPNYYKVGKLWRFALSIRLVGIEICYTCYI